MWTVLCEKYLSVFAQKSKHRLNKFKYTVYRECRPRFNGVNLVLLFKIYENYCGGHFEKNSSSTSPLYL